MLVGAALVPDTALLVPGAAGRADVLDTERRAALEAVGAVVACDPSEVVVVVPGRPGDAPHVAAAGRASLAAAGVPDDVGPPARATGRRAARAAGATDTTPVDPSAPGVGEAPGGVPAAVGLHLLARAGWTGAVRVLVAGGDDVASLAAAGHGLARDTERLALLAVGSLSARRGPDGPLPTDDRAPRLEEQVVADLLDLSADGRAWLAAVPAPLAAELAVSAWGPWQVLVGAARPDVAAPGLRRGRLGARSAPYGATYVVVDWTPDAVVPGDAPAPGAP